jgi:hypothetical protein
MFILSDIKKFQKHSLLEILFSVYLALCKKFSYLVFFTDLHFGTFCDEINFENLKKSPKIKHKEAKYKTAIPMKFLSKVRHNTNGEIFSFVSSFFGGGGGGTKIGLCNEIIHP